MDPVEALERLGGVAGTATLLGLTTPGLLRGALVSGRIRRICRGVLVLPGAEQAVVSAARLGGVVSHLSAAQLHGWEVAFSPTHPWVTVPRNREVHDRRGTQLFWASLDGEPGPVTTPLRTVVDCGRRLAFGPALAVADSALRHRAVDVDELQVAAAGVRGMGAAAVREVAQAADRRAANPFESMLRAHAIRSGLDVVPQHPVPLPGLVVHPDLVDVGRRLYWRRTRGSSTPVAKPTSGTAGGTPPWSWPGGRCCASPGARSGTSPTGCWPASDTSPGTAQGANGPALAPIDGLWPRLPPVAVSRRPGM
jgi:hypothetical protein